MVGDTFLIWDGLGVGGWWWWLGNCRKKKSCTKKKRQKIYCKAIHAKETGSKLMAKIVLLRKIFNSRKGQRTNQKYRNLVGSDQQMQRLA